MFALLAALLAQSALDDPAAGSCQASSIASSPCVLKPSQKARPRSNPGLWISTDADYPSKGLRMGMQGTVGFRLTIAADGRVRACEITQRSGFTELDQTTCRLMMRRARFCPATDAKAKPITGSWDGRVKWTLPDNDPPPAL